MRKKPGNGDYLHKEHPKSCASDDFWGQVSRTVHGVPVSQDQINMIVSAIKDGLAFSSEDVLLDIGCGNGALSRYFFDDILQFQGVDYSEYLIEIAKTNFEKAPDYIFKEFDAASYVQNEAEPERFTKCLIYGAFTYLSSQDAEIVLSGLFERFIDIKTVYIGNLPDRDRAHLFYPEGKEFSHLLDDKNSPIGIWRSKNDFIHIVNKAGWDIDIREMPEGFYAAYYRYDVILRRPINRLLVL